jgi:hypothetical protein
MKLVVRGDGEPYEPIMALKKYFYPGIFTLDKL